MTKLVIRNSADGGDLAYSDSVTDLLRGDPQSAPVRSPRACARDDMARRDGP